MIPTGFTCLGRNTFESRWNPFEDVLAIAHDHMTTTQTETVFHIWHLNMDWSI